MSHAMLWMEGWEEQKRHQGQCIRRLREWSHDVAEFVQAIPASKLMRGESESSRSRNIKLEIKTDFKGATITNNIFVIKT